MSDYLPWDDSLWDARGPFLTPAAGTVLGAVQPKKNGIYEVRWSATAPGTALAVNLRINYGGQIVAGVLVGGQTLPGGQQLGSNSFGKLFMRLSQGPAALLTLATIATEPGVITYTGLYFTATQISDDYPCRVPSRSPENR